MAPRFFCVMDKLKDMDIINICSQFTDDVMTGIRRIGDGHINDTFYIKGEKGEYLLQKLNPVLFGENREIIEHNYLQYAKACENISGKIKEWELPRWLKCRAGGFFCVDGNRAPWRMYTYIKGDTLKSPYSKEQIRACGEGLSKLHFILSQIKEVPGSALPGLHDTAAYYRDYLSCREDAQKSRRDSALEAVIDDRAGRMTSLKLPENAVIHGDARIGNMLFKDGRVIAMIDLDTIMWGPRILDIADCIRSCCINEGRPDQELVKTLVSAYRDAGYMLIGDDEWKILPQALELICFELGLRYYTDHLRGNVYFAEDCPGRNLQKAGWLLHSLDEVIELQIL